MSEDFWNDDTVVHLVVLKHGTDDTSRGAHCPVQHVDVLRLAKRCKYKRLNIDADLPSLPIKWKIIRF